MASISDPCRLRFKTGRFIFHPQRSSGPLGATSGPYRLDIKSWAPPSLTRRGLRLETGPPIAATG